MSRPRLRSVKAEKDLKKAFSIRVRVFVREQGVPREIELDQDDKIAKHLLAEVSGRAVGTARVVVKDGRAKVGRMAVLKSYRGKGIGRHLLRGALSLARRSGAKVVFLHAQVPVIGFYEKVGFRCVGRTFMEAGIPHRRMVLKEDFPASSSFGR